MYEILRRTKLVISRQTFLDIQVRGGERQREKAREREVGGGGGGEGERLRYSDDEVDEACVGVVFIFFSNLTSTLSMQR